MNMAIRMTRSKEQENNTKRIGGSLHSKTEYVASNHKSRWVGMPRAAMVAHVVLQ